MPTPSNTDRFVWCDLETFGLDYQNDPILEIGFVITDVNLVKIDEFQTTVWEDGMYDAKLEVLKKKALTDPSADFVLKMHHASRLWDQAQEFGMDLEEAAAELNDWLGDNKINEGDPICGSSVQFDRNMLARWMPDCEKLFSYRNIDLSSVKELCMRWNPGLYARMAEAVVPAKKHRVLPDIEDTLNEARFYGVEFLMTGDEVEL